MLSLRLSSVSRLLSLPLTLVASASAARADVLVVDPVAGPYLQIQDAVLAAQPRDVILVRQGSYDPVVVDNKPLSIVADSGAFVLIVGTTIVRALPANEVCVLSGLRCEGAAAAGGQAGLGIGLRLESNAGFVRVEGCEVNGAAGYGETVVDETCSLPPEGEGCTAVRVLDSLKTSFTACSMRGGNAQDTFPYTCLGFGKLGGQGLRGTGSFVALYDSSLEGGRGGGNGSGGDGGHGMRGSAFASRSSFQGGLGGESYDFLGPGGRGGHGMHADGPSQQIDCAFVGGAGGPSCCGMGPGPAGTPIFGGPVFDFLVPHAELIAPRVVREGETLQLTIRGVPGALAVLRSNTTPDFRVTPSQRGVELVRQPVPARMLQLGTIPASGEMQVSLTAASLAAGQLASMRYLQLAVHDAQTGVTLGSSYALLVLDSTL